MAFGAQIAEAMDTFGPLSVGVDPSPQMLAHWGLPDTPEGLLTFGQAVVEASERAVAAVKIQIAFFERHGSAGIAALAAKRPRSLRSSRVPAPSVTSRSRSPSRSASKRSVAPARSGAASACGAGA